jgi:predicted metal-binding protein
MAIEEDLSTLCTNAKTYGASRVSVLPASEVVIDPRVRLKCQVPVCPNYGVNLMCPPRTMDPADFAKVLRGFSHTILVQTPICDNPDHIQGFMNGDSVEIMEADREYPMTIRKGLENLLELMGKLEKDASNMGYRFSAALSGGPCKLCERCVGQKTGSPCRYPFKARPSMQALGVDVFQTAENAGMPPKGPNGDGAYWTGLLLVD